MTTKTTDRVQVIVNTDPIDKLQNQIKTFEETLALSSKRLAALAAERDSDPDYRVRFVAAGAYELASKDQDRADDYMSRQLNRLATLQGLNTVHAEKLARALASLVESEVTIIATTAENTASVKLDAPALAVVSTPNSSGNPELGRYLQVVYRVPRQWRGLEHSTIGKALHAAKQRQVQPSISGLSINESLSEDPQGRTYVYRVGAVGDVIDGNAAR